MAEVPVPQPIPDSTPTPTRTAGEFPLGTYQANAEAAQKQYDTLKTAEPTATQTAEAADHITGAGYTNEPYPAGVPRGLGWEKPTNDADALFSGGKEGLLEKPTNEATDFFNQYKEQLLSNLTPEQTEALQRGLRESMKKLLEIDDTAQLNPQAKKVFDAYSGWLLGKMVK